MKTKSVWSVSNVKNASHIGIHEFQDNKGEWHNFEILHDGNRLVFGRCCNVGFLESGYLELEDGEIMQAGWFELMEDLETYYNDGPKFVSRIVVNERM